MTSLGRPTALALLLAVLAGAGCEASGASAASVAMTGERRFVPATVAVPVGGSVTWQNTGVTVHTATAIGEDRQPTGAFDSGEVVGTGTYTQSFDEAGVFTYTCAIHGGEMVGLVEVGS